MKHEENIKLLSDASFEVSNAFEDGFWSLEERTALLEASDIIEKVLKSQIDANAKKTEGLKNEKV